jgi:hypothetical protein
MTREYFGILIHRNTEPHKLRYWAFTPSGQVAADTLAGIKAAIRESRS